MGMVLKSNGAYIFIIANSFIHSLMYCYYAMSVLKISYFNAFLKQFKPILTSMQMTQFVLVNCIALIQVYCYYDIMQWADTFCILYHVFYAFILFILFNKFYTRTYKKGTNRVKKID